MKKIKEELPLIDKSLPLWMKENRLHSLFYLMKNFPQLGNDELRELLTLRLRTA